MAAQAQKVISERDKHGAQEMSMARLAAVVDDILRILEHLPPAYRVQALRLAEEKVRPLSIASRDIIRKLSVSGNGYYIALPNELSSLVGTYHAHIMEGKLILESGGDDVRIRVYGRKLRMKLPKRLVEALGYPEYVRVRVEGSRIIVEPAG